MASQMTDSQGGMEHEPSKLLEIWAGWGVLFLSPSLPKTQHCLRLHNMAAERTLVGMWWVMGWEVGNGPWPSHGLMCVGQDSRDVGNGWCVCVCILYYNHSQAKDS